MNGFNRYSTMDSLSPSFGENFSSLLRRMSNERDREQRLQICLELRNLILDARDFKALNREPFSVLRYFDELLHTRMNLETKREIAKCLGAMGFIMGHKTKDYLVWLFENYERTTVNEIKSLYMTALTMTYASDDNRRRLEKITAKTLSDLQKVLEQVESPQVLTSILEAITTVSSSYPDLFAAHFKDIVDIVVGWYVDTDQEESVLNQCGETLTKLQQFWLSGMEFTLSMLTHFLEDAETYIEDMKTNPVKSRSESMSPNDDVKKSAALMRAFQTILSSISEYFIVTMDNKAYCQFVEQNVGRLTSCLESCTGKEIAGLSSFVDSALESLKLFLDICRMLPDMVLQPVSVLFTKVADGGNLADTSALALIGFAKKIISQSPSDMVSKYVGAFIGPSGCIFKLRSHHNQNVVKQALSAYKLLLVPRGVKCLQEVYRYVLGEIESSLENMHSATGSKDSLSLPSVPEGTPWLTGSTNYSTIYAEAVVIYLSTALVELASAKSSVIGMWALTPSLFQLLTNELPTTAEWFRNYYPAAQYSLISTLKVHCDKHDHFIANSDLLTDGAAGSMLAFAQSAKHFEIVVNLLISLFNGKTSADVLALGLRWSKDLIEAVNRSGSTLIFRLPVFRNLFLAIANCRRGMAAVKVDYSCCLTTAVKFARRWFTPEMFQSCSRALISLVLETRNEAYFGCLSEFPLWEVLTLDFTGSNKDTIRRMNAECVTPATNFDASCFKLIIDFILNNAPLVDEEQRSPIGHSRAYVDRLMMIHARCTESTRRDQVVTAPYLWHWILWQLGLFCVNCRLKTSLGKPQDTFLAIEGELKALANEALKVETRPSGDAACEKPKFAAWFRVRLLLNFMETFDKLMYNAYEGTAFALPAVSKAAKAFFRTNKSTCLEWLNRIRLAVMTVALHNGSYSMVIRLGWTALRDLETNGPKSNVAASSERFLLLMSQALLALNSASSLLGLYAWSKKYLNLKLPWIKIAADQAVEKYEVASKDYLAFLEDPANLGRKTSNENELSDQTSNVVAQFCSDATVKCYAALNDYGSARLWLEKLPNDSVDWTNESTKSSVAVQEKLSMGNLDEARSHWQSLDRTTGPKLSWGSMDYHGYFSGRFLQAALQEKDQTRIATVNDSLDELNEYQWLNVCSRWPEQLSQDSEIRRQHFYALTATDPTSVDIGIAGRNPRNLQLRHLSDFHQTLRIRDLSRASKQGSITSDLCLWMSYNARKSSNYNFAATSLSRYAGLESSSQLSTYVADWQASVDVKRLLVGYHASKLTFALDDRKAAFSLMCSAVSGFLDGCTNAMAQLQQQTNCGVNSVVDLLTKALALSSESGRGAKGSNSMPNALMTTVGGGGTNPTLILSKCLSTLADWLAQENSFGQVLLMNDQTFFIQLLEQELQMTERVVGALDTDCVVGSLLSLSWRVCPENYKSDVLLADWAYKTARKHIEGSSREERVKLSEEDLAFIEATCKDEPETVKDSVVSLLSSLRSDDGAIASDEELRNELGSLSLGISLGVDSLLQIWQRANYRVFLLYGIAADSYLRLLHLTDQKPSSAVTAALRLLRLLVKHFSDMQQFMSGSFTSVPAKAWKGIIPQLFARLNHPSGAVRGVITATLCQIAESHPEVVAFPTVVGSMSSGFSKRRQHAAEDLFAVTTGVNALDEMESDLAINFLDIGTRDEHADDVFMDDAYAVVMESLRSKNATMVEDIKSFVTELQRITLLREEVWFSALTHMEPEVSKRLSRLQEDIQATEKRGYLSQAEKQSIISEKCDIMSTMVFQTVTDLYEATSGEPQTANEQQFFDLFCPMISAALTNLSGQLKPQEIWTPFAKLLHTLYNRLRPALDMNDISPTLATLRSSHIPMPGLTASSNVIMIESVCAEVTVLPTKTRPKKLRVIGSDGHKYSYLFKGLEDLHLDERMMQFLSVCNTLFDPKKSLEKCSYNARYYSVTPLGHRSGLIQWVEKATPTFSLYKRWQMREVSANPGQSVETRPSDLFRRKLEPLLNRRGIFDMQNRQKWPHSILREVLTELISETPRDLLQKEFWCLSNDADSWWRITQNFARSTAVMSVIGYLIGLGDRHLDNLLVDFQSGEVIHIDYNVCFEKGVHLRVPEKVPFRMTPNMRAALGPTGVEGTFRVSCEESLRFLRHGGEALLTLLEAFVYDPLVDWTTTHETGVANFLGHNVLFTIYGPSRLQKYAELGHQLAYRSFVVRVREISTPWLKNKEAMLNALQAYHDQLCGTLSESLDTATMEAKRHKALADHHLMMLEVRGLIKSLAKYEESTVASERPFSEYMQAYKAFSEALTNFLKSSFPDESKSVATETLSDMSNMVQSAYGGLLTLASQSDGRHSGAGDGKGIAVDEELATDSFSGGPSRKQVPPARRRKQGRNVHALGVWRRVKAKLEGFDPDVAKRSTVAEQVDYLIREATSVDNLAVMYEGWTAWV